MPDYLADVNEQAEDMLFQFVVSLPYNFPPHRALQSKHPFSHFIINQGCVRVVSKNENGV